MIPQEIQNTIHSLDFENDGFITFKSFNLDSIQPELIIEIYPGADELPKEQWKITITNHKRHEILTNGCSDIILTDSHCLLSDFNQYSGEIFVNERTDNSADMFRELYSLHRKEFCDWIPFDKYITHAFDNLDKFDLDFGSFAKGPLNILELYAQTLKKYYSKVNIVGKYGRKKSTKDIGWTSDDTNYSVLIMEYSFIIGGHFEFKKIK